MSKNIGDGNNEKSDRKSVRKGKRDITSGEWKDIKNKE